VLLRGHGSPRLGVLRLSALIPEGVVSENIALQAIIRCMGRPRDGDREHFKWVGGKGRTPRFSGDFPAEAGRPTEMKHTHINWVEGLDRLALAKL